jgi:hypothetical protein
LRRADGRALLAARDAADERARARAARGRQLVAVLLPERAAVLVPVADATAVRVAGAAVPVPHVAALRRRLRRRDEREQREHDQNGK